MGKQQKLVQVSENKIFIEICNEIGVKEIEEFSLGK